MPLLFKAIFAAFVVVQLTVTLVDSLYVARRFFPYAAWSLFRSYSEKAVVFPQVTVYQYGNQSFPYGKDLIDFTRAEFRQLDDRFNFINLLIEFYHQARANNVSRALELYKACHDTLNGGGVQVEWELQFLKINPYEYLKSRQALEENIFDVKGFLEKHGNG